MFWGYDTWKNRKTHCNFLRVQIGRSADRLAVLNLLSEPWFKSNGRSSMFFGRTNFTLILTVPAPRLENRKVILTFRHQCHTPLGKLSTPLESTRSLATRTPRFTPRPDLQTRTTTRDFKISSQIRTTSSWQRTLTVWYTQLHYHVVYAHWCFHFLFVGCFDLVNCHPFALGKDKLEKEVAILLLVHTDGFDFRQGDRAVVTLRVSTWPKEDSKIRIVGITWRETDIRHVPILELEV